MPPARSKLTQLAPLFRAATRIRMIGFTDDLGSAHVNSRLASDRALQVRSFVQQLIGAATRPVLSSRGEALCCYLTNNRDEGKRSANRRVEVLITLPASDDTEALIRRFAPLLVSTDTVTSGATDAASPHGAVPAVAIAGTARSERAPAQAQGAPR